MSAPQDPPAQDKRLMSLFVAHLLRVLEGGDTTEIPAATLSVIRQFLSDNSITIASVRRGDFGPVVQRAAEDFPFNDNGAPVAGPMMGSAH